MFNRFFKTINSIRILRRQFTLNSNLKSQAETKIKPNLRLYEERKEIGPFGWFLLVCFQHFLKHHILILIILQSIPTATFALGTWQIQRKKWKENLIRSLQERKHATPVQLPSSADEIAKLEYFPVHVKGRFVHDKEIYIGPRSLLVEGDASTQSSLISKGQNTNQGYLVVTPFELSDRKYECT